VRAVFKCDCSTQSGQEERAPRLPFLNELLARAGAKPHKGPHETVCVRGKMSPEALQSFLAVALGSVAGLLCTLYQLLTLRPASFCLLQAARGEALAFLPFLAFAAPFIIMRNTLQGQREAPLRLESIMMATVVAAFWSMLSGTLVEMTVEALERLIA
jgi:hypothetical protein